MIFVDTSAWFACTVPTDPFYADAIVWLGENSRDLISTDYIVDETLTLFRVRNEAVRALEIGQSFFDGTLCEIIRVTDDDSLEAWEIFRRFSDKKWSFTDCVSKVVMERLGITTAFAFDQHFRQFGTVQVVP